MSTSDDYQVPVRDGHSCHPQYTAPEEMYWLSHLDKEDLCEKYVGIRDDFYTLKKFSCKQEDKIKKLQTKLRKLIADRKTDGSGRGGRGLLSVQEMEYQDTLEARQHTIRELRSKNELLERKLKLASVQLSTARKNRPLLFKHVGPRVDSGLKSTRTPVASPLRQRPRPNSSPPKPTTSSDDSSALASALSPEHKDLVLPEKVREILEEARERILGLEAERDELQDHLAEKQQAAEDAEYELQQKISMLEEEVGALREELHDRGVREERDSVAVVRAERESRTLSARTTALQEQLVVTEEKVAAEKSRKESLQNELERMTGKLLATEKQLREVQQEYQKVGGQLQQTVEKKNVLETENQQLQSENERLTALNLSVEQRGLATENEALKTQIAHLESALQSDLHERGNFLEHLTRDKEALARAEDDVRSLSEKNNSLKEDLDRATQKLNIYSKAGLLDMTEKDLSNAFTKYKQEESGSLSAKEVEELRQAHSELQLLYREKTVELERTSTALLSHSHTYKTLQDQVTQVTKESQEKETHLQLTIKNLQETIKKRDERHDRLEHQLLMLTDKGLRDKQDLMGGTKLSQTVSLSKHDNALEFHIESVTFEVLDPGSQSHLKTFVSWTVPFSLEDPLQHTNVAIGTHAHYNYSALYKFHMNHRNLVSLREDTVTVTVYILLDSGHPAKVGECSLTFCEILDHPRNTLHGTVPVYLSHDDAEEAQHLPTLLHGRPGEVIGTMNYWFRLQRPCEEVIAQHLRNVTLLTTSQHREDLLPKESKVIASKNPVIAKRISSQQHGRTATSHEPSAATNARDNVEEETPELPHPVPAPRSQSLMSVLSQAQHTSPKRSDTSKPKEKPYDGSPETDKRIGSSPVPTESQITSAVSPRELRSPLECRHSGSESPGSTGTYNVSSPTKMDESDLIHIDEEPHSRKSITLQKTSNLESSAKSKQPSSHAERRASTGFSSKSVRPKSAFPGKSERSTSEGEDESSTSVTEQRTHGSSQAHLPKGRREQVVHADNKASGSSSSGKDSDTMIEGSSESEEESEYPHRDPHQRGKPVTKSTSKEPVRRKELAKGSGNTSTSCSNSHATTSNSKNSNNSSSSSSRRGRERQLSSSLSNITTDSEGVVAVVSKNTKTKRSKVYVEVCSLTLHPEASVIQDPSVELIFVDYHGFLGLPPDQLETPSSLPKPPPGRSVNFNFGQEFSVDKRQYPEREQSLVDLMKNRGILKFTVTSEPPAELQDTHDCQDLGYTFVNLHELLRKGQDLQEEELVVESAEDGSQMGVLTITLHIVSVLKNLKFSS